MWPRRVSGGDSSGRRGKRQTQAAGSFGLPKDRLPDEIQFIADPPHDHAELDAAEGR